MKHKSQNSSDQEGRTKKATADNHAAVSGGGDIELKPKCLERAKKKEARDDQVRKTDKNATGVSGKEKCGSLDRHSSKTAKDVNRQLHMPPFPLYGSHQNRATTSPREGLSSSSSSSSEPSSYSFREGLASLVKLLKARKRIVVLTGAGISVSCGIPDFRSKGTGLYATLDAAVSARLPGEWKR